MNITFLIGNGFDLGLGMKTSYEDFYEVYTIEKDDDNENIRGFKRTLKNRNGSDNKIINWSDFELAFGLHSNEFSEFDIDLYKERYIHFVKHFNLYLENENKKFDFSEKQKIANRMYEAVDKYFYIREGDRQFIQQLYNKIKGDQIYNFVSFNYTNCLDMCVKILEDKLKSYSSRRIGDVIHVHGYIEKNMILGVNDTSQIDNDFFAKDDWIIKNIVKPQQNLSCRTTYDNKVSSLINKSNIICIYGMSIGETDKKWWELVVDWLTRSSDNALIVLTHVSSNISRFVFDQNDQTDFIIDKILSFSSKEDKIKNNIKNRIFVGWDDIFSLQLSRIQDEK